MTEEQRAKIYSFAASCDLGVIATNSHDRNSPEAACVAVTITENLEIVFGTSADSRKSKNIALNPNVTFVIGGDETRKTTIQIEGTALLLEDAERKTAEELHCIRHPNSAKYRNDPQQQYFKMTPHWIRYHNSSAHPTEKWEINL
jgi:general stress protein 26